MGDELEATTAFCAKYGITHVGIWARTMLGQDKLSELKREGDDRRVSREQPDTYRVVAACRLGRLTGVAHHK